MKCAAYARIRLDKQHESEQDEKISLQINAIEKWARKNGHTIVGKYIDKGVSGGDYNRPGFVHIIHDALSPNHPFDAIVVETMSRIFGTIEKMPKYIKVLDHKKVKIFSIVLSNFDEESGRMIRKFISAFAEYDKREKKEKKR